MISAMEEIVSNVILFRNFSGNSLSFRWVIMFILRKLESLVYKKANISILHYNESLILIFFYLLTQDFPFKSYTHEFSPSNNVLYGFIRQKIDDDL